MWRDRMAGQRGAPRAGQCRQQRAGRPAAARETGAAWCWSPAAGTWATCPARSRRCCWTCCRRTQAQEMFTRLAPRAAGSPGEVAEVVRLAGFLPLAISLLARLFARHPSWTLADLAAETRASLLTLTAENDSVAAAFEVSYRHLDPAGSGSSACWACTRAPPPTPTPPRRWPQPA